MKIRTMEKSYDEVMALPRMEHQKPLKPSTFLSLVMRAAAIPDLIATHFKYEKINMDKAGEGPWLILMNHSSFLDLEIVSKIMFPKKYNIICTSDGFVGKEKLMRKLGCIPTQKFVTDMTLMSDIKYAIKDNNTSVLMYPEASYSFDGTATKLPRRLGVLFKSLNVPVVMITTYGSFARDPLYNNLQKRKVKVTAKMECLLSKDEISAKSVAEIDDILDKAFDFDYFKWQKQNRVEITEDFRADGLNRILYKCPHCMAEGKTVGRGVKLYCNNCGEVYFLETDGSISRVNGEAKFNHIPDWYAWERSEVKKAIENKTYSLDSNVKIGIIVDTKAVYMVGEGKLHHDNEGFTLTGTGKLEGKLFYKQKPEENYGLYSDYYWYSIGDVICLGKKDCLYYCFPEEKDIVAKARTAAEELFKISRQEREQKRLEKAAASSAEEK